MRRLSITLFSLCLASALTAQTTGSNQSVRLRADNIDEVVSAMTLEEKVHLVIGCGMSMGSDTKFPGTAGRTYDIPRLGIPSAYLADGPHRLAMAAKREFDSRTYHATEFPSSTTVAATFNPDAAHKVGRTLVPGVYSPIPMGAFYTVAKLPVDDSEKFCAWCLEEFDYEGETVMMAPASGFYTTPGKGKNEVRVAYVLKKEDLVRALYVLRKALDAYPGRVDD